MRSFSATRKRNLTLLRSDRAIAQLRACRPIPESEVRELCHKARELLIEEGNVVTVNAPVTVRYFPVWDGVEGVGVLVESQRRRTEREI